MKTTIARVTQELADMVADVKALADRLAPAQLDSMAAARAMLALHRSRRALRIAQDALRGLKQEVTANAR
jgi:hypothetical protein